MTSWLTGLEVTVASWVAALLNLLWQGVVLFAMVWLALRIGPSSTRRRATRSGWQVSSRFVCFPFSTWPCRSRTTSNKRLR